MAVATLARTAGPMVAEFLETFCRQSRGDVAGQPLQLRPWQRELLDDLFALRPDGTRRYRTALIGLPRKNGKALAVDTALPTPSGWTTMGAIQPGDVLFDERGRVCRVVAGTDVMAGRPCYTVAFSDGSSITADADHLWRTEARRTGRRVGQRWADGDDLRTTAQIAATLRVSSPSNVAADRVEWNHRIPIAGPLQLPDVGLSVPPYTLGAWLGDGTSTNAGFTCAHGDGEILEHIRAEGVAARRLAGMRCWLGDGDRGVRRHVSVQARLRALGVLGQKHIPPQYLRAGTGQRWALLQGLMDTDGYVSRAGQCEFTTVTAALCRDVTELLCGLGFKPSVKQDRAWLYGKDCGPKYRIQFWAYVDTPVFRLERKRLRQKPPPVRPTRAASRQIVDVSPVESVPVRCIQVDSPSGLFLAGRSMIPTHNSTLCSGLALYGLIADGEPGAEIYSCAGDRQQARIVFEEAKRMAQQDLDLRGVLTFYRDAIEVKATNSVYRVLSADAELKQGLNPHWVIFDEVHVQPNDALWNAMVLGMGTRRQPLQIGITTAGYDEDSLLYGLYAHGKRIQKGEVDDPTFFFRWWEPADENCDWLDQRAWHEANPMLGDVLSLEALEHDARTTPEHEFRRFHLDSWTKTAAAWLPFGAWDACKDAARQLDPALPTRVGIDMAYSNDCAAVVAAQRQADGVTVLRARVWENPYAPTHSQHAHWKINPLEVEAYLRELRERFPVPSSEIDGEVKPGPEFCYDPAWFTRSAPVLEGDGLAMVEWPQSDSRMVPVAQTFYQLVTEKKIAHDGDPALKRHVENAIVDRRPRGWRISKATVKRKIDACIAAAIAAYRAQEPAPARRELYAGRDLLVLG